MLLSGGLGHAQTISNIAQASWSAGGRSVSVRSNLVTLTVEPAAAAIEPLRIVPGSSRTAMITPARCAGSASAIAAPDAGQILGVDRAEALRPGEQLLVAVTAPSANRDSAAIDTVSVIATSTAGDREVIEAFETAANSGVFVGNLPTGRTPPAAQGGDCRLSVAPGERVLLEAQPYGLTQPIAATPLIILADPYGVVFDSADGSPVDGVRVTLVDGTTGAPAQVLAEDGLTAWPSTVVTGQAVSDAAGGRHAMGPGEFRFPLTAPGSYRLQVDAPSPYSAPSAAPPAQLSGLRDAAGLPFAIGPASYGARFDLAGPAPVDVDIPIDAPSGTIGLTKTASRPSAGPGDAVFYTVTIENGPGQRPRRGVSLVDNASTALRLRPESVRIDGAAVAQSITFAPDGRGMTVALGDLPPGTVRRITYAASIREDAAPGEAINRAEVSDNGGVSATAAAAVRIERETVASRMTLAGRVTRGDCRAAATGVGIAGVRLMLEDGSFAITDSDGRYHFDGLLPGTHVVQAESATLPGTSARFVDCARSTRSAGTGNSRFVTGQGGALAIADFVADVGEAATGEAHAPPAAALSDPAAAGAETDFLAAGDGPVDWLFPAVDHNPRAPAVRVAIRHRLGQKVELSVDGRPVDAIAFDGVKSAPEGAFAVSIWRGIPLSIATTRLRALVWNPDGSVAAQLAREVHFAATPARAELVASRSRLVADGATRPILAVRILDRDGRPVHAGLAGELSLNPPYESAAALAMLGTGDLTTPRPATPRWTVTGDDGIALVELAPTMVSGALHAQFTFTDGAVRRRQALDTWVVPGDQKWTLVGLAEGALGEALDSASSAQESDLGEHARVAFYAKGRVLGSTLLTVAYDSRKNRDDQRLLGTIDPRAYYTVFADRSDRRFDAASREQLYVRIESQTFYALYGDFETGFDQTELARYRRTATGFKGEAALGGLQASAFAAEMSTRHRRDEIQGNGLSGPYPLSSRSILANSETVAIERRDRFRSEIVLERTLLVRMIDYDIDPLSGTIAFARPVLSRDGELNPQIIVVDYETDELGGGRLNAGVRAAWTSAGGALRMGATALSDKGDGPRTDMAAADIALRLGTATELRAEVGASRGAGATRVAWLAEAEHHDGRLDLLVYGRSLDPGYGVGQQSRAERSRRKFGLDARVALTDDLSLTGSSWYDTSLDDAARRAAAQLRAELRRGPTDARIGVSWFHDRFADGRSATSTVLEGGVAQRLLDNRLELDASASIALGATGSIDLPARHRIGARYALSPDVKLVGSYEIAGGAGIDARTARAGFELAPWAGARLVTTFGRQDIAEQGKRSFAAFGLSQSWQATPALTLDATIDGNRVLGGFDAERVINPEHPVASGGFLGEGGVLSEDFNAVTLGAGYRTGRWSASARGEYRDGQFADRRGFVFGAIRQIGEGSVVGSGFTWTRANGLGGARSEVFDALISAAWRPAGRPLAALGKLEYRSDAVAGATAGPSGPAALTALTVSGDAASRRLLASLSGNWSPRGRDHDRLVQRSEIGVFLGARYGLDRLGDVALSGLSLLGGLDARIGLGDRFEIGGSATVRTNRSDRTTAFAFGPAAGFSPAKDLLVTVGYNIAGFRDRDFSASRFTDKGLVAGIKLKFDAGSLAFLGLGR